MGTLHISYTHDYMQQRTRIHTYIHTYTLIRNTTSPRWHGLGAIVNAEVEAEVSVCEGEAWKLVVGHHDHRQRGRPRHLSPWNDTHSFIRVIYCIYVREYIHTYIQWGLEPSYDTHKREIRMSYTYGPYANTNFYTTVRSTNIRP